MIEYELCIYIDYDDTNLEFNGKRIGQKHFRDSILEGKYDFDMKLLRKVLDHKYSDDWIYNWKMSRYYLMGKITTSY